MLPEELLFEASPNHVDILVQLVDVRVAARDAVEFPDHPIMTR